MVKKEVQEDEQTNSKEVEIAGISVISSIVDKATTATPLEILAALKQIFFFYKLIPDSWKKKAYYIFEKLWNKKQVIISTNPDQPEKIYEVYFEDSKLQGLFDALPQIDQALLLQGKAMCDLIGKGIHNESDEIKKNIELRYGRRGLNIVDMLTTGDIKYLLEEIEDVSKVKEGEKKFNEWAQNYDTISALISPIDLKTDVAEKKIITVSKKTNKPYSLVNLSGKMEDCTKLLSLIDSLKAGEKLLYKKLTPDIYDSGFCKSIRIKIDFK